MNLTKYVKTFGQYTFDERPFNDVDAAVLSIAVYSNLEVIAPSIFDEKSTPVPFNSIQRFDLEVVTAGKTLVIGNKKLIPAIVKSKRFGPVTIQNVRKVLDIERANQFYACTYNVPGYGKYIAFRGTDSSIVGWKEDFKFSVHKTVVSQLDAVDYINFVANNCGDSIMIGGHSKGGNLSIYSALNCSELARNRIQKIYSFDGNGLNGTDNYNTEAYDVIKDKIVLIRPQDSYVGQFLDNPSSDYIVKSRAVSIFQHDVQTWLIDEHSGEFIRAPHFTPQSLLRHDTLNIWLTKVNEQEVELMIDFVVKLLGGDDKTVFDFLFKIGKTLHFLKVYNSFKKEDKKVLRRSIKLVLESRKEAKAMQLLERK